MNNDKQPASVLTHVDMGGNPSMVDISDKAVTRREAIANAIVSIPPELLALQSSGEIVAKKGPVFQTAIIAGTQAVKSTAQMIPFCHQIPIAGCQIAINIVKDKIVIECKVKTIYATGVEMEALTGASIAALTIYDMCKAISHNITIENICLKQKTGGKSDYEK